jgi:hypothetical protein
MHKIVQKMTQFHENLTLCVYFCNAHYVGCFSIDFQIPAEVQKECVFFVYILFHIRMTPSPPPLPPPQLQEWYKKGEKRGRRSLIADPFLYSVISMI